MNEYTEYSFKKILELLKDPAGFAAADTAVLIFLGVCAGILVFALLAYILVSWGLHKLARDRRIRHGWLAWFPLGNVWILGSIADQYHFVAKGRVRGRRKTLLSLNLTVAILLLLQAACAICNLAYTYGWFSIGYQIAVQLAAAGELLQLAVMVVSFIALIHQCIALHDLYASCEPDSAAAFLVVSMVIPVTMPFFVFSCRNKEYGMPPRKPAIPVPATWQPPQIPDLDA